MRSRGSVKMPGGNVSAWCRAWLFLLSNGISSAGVFLFDVARALRHGLLIPMMLSGVLAAVAMEWWACCLVCACGVVIGWKARGVLQAEASESKTDYQADHDEVMGLRLDPPPAPKPRQEMPIAGRGGMKAPPSGRGNRGQGTVHTIRSIEPAPNLAQEPRAVIGLRDSHERMNDPRRMHGTPMDVLGLEPGKMGGLPAKHPPSEEQVRAFHRSLDEQRRIEGARVLDAAERWSARRRREREGGPDPTSTRPNFDPRR